MILTRPLALSLLVVNTATFLVLEILGRSVHALEKEGPSKLIYPKLKVKTPV